MLIQLRTRVPKRTEEEIVLNLPMDDPAEATWKWADKAFRAQDIVEIMRLNDRATVVTVWNELKWAYTTLLVDEVFEDVFDKWEEAEQQPLVLHGEEFPEEDED